MEEETREEPIEIEAKPAEPKVFEVTVDMTQAQFDDALYRLGFDGAQTYQMWVALNADGIIVVRLKKA